MISPSAPPLTTSPIAIDEAWIDYNGHLNMAYYNVIFDQALEQLLRPVGLGPDYIRDSNCTYMAVEAHICYLREVLRADIVRVSLRILDLDPKRMHLFCEMRHATEDWPAATSEWMFLNVDMAARRTAPWPPHIFGRLEAIRQAGESLGMPDMAGRRIGIPRRT